MRSPLHLRFPLKRLRTRPSNRRSGSWLRSFAHSLPWQISLPPVTSWVWQGVILFLLWLGVVAVDSLWLSLDQSAPAWDEGDHLTRAMNYWRVLQQPQLWSSQWWTDLWLLSPGYRAPLIYLLTVPILSLFGRGFDQALGVNILFAAILMVTVYALGKRLFDARTGLWAAAFCGLAPTLVDMRLHYLLDYGVAVMTVVAFAMLTGWQLAARGSDGWRTWLWSGGFGISFGLMLMTRPNSLLFLLVPLAWVAIAAIYHRQWRIIVQLLLAVGLAWLMVQGWFLTNWLTIISHLNQAKNWGTLYQVDPTKKGLLGWLYYGRVLPEMLPWPLLVSGLGCWLLSLWLPPHQSTSRRRQSYSRRDRPAQFSTLEQWAWLWAYCLSAYVLHSWTANKDMRFILPYLPIVILMLSRGLTLWLSPWLVGLRWGVAVLATVLMLANFLPIPGLNQWGGRYLPYLGAPFPNAQVVAEISQTQPYLRSNLGMVVNTSTLNPMNMDFYGAAAGFQVYARQLAFTENTAQQDGRSLEWYLTKTGDQGEYTTIEAGQAALKRAVETDPDIRVHRTWTLPDGSELRLHRRIPFVTVTPLTAMATATEATPQSEGMGDRVHLTQISVPKTAPPGQPIPVTYALAGSWEALRSGLLLLTWQQIPQPIQPSPTVNADQPTHTPQAASALRAKPRYQWLHDHGIGLGQLTTPIGTERPAPPAHSPFQVTERLAMLAPADAPTGRYSLQAAYLNRVTGETYPLQVPQVQLRLDAKSKPVAAPELDLISQLRALVPAMAAGQLEPIGATIGRINQYDPIQDYLIQTEKLLMARLQQTPNDLQLTYSLALAYVLQRRAVEAIATVTQITELDSHNPWAWAYLGFLRLYNGQPGLAQTALDRAQQLNPNLAEVKTLQGVAAAMQLNLPRAWALLR